MGDFLKDLFNDVIDMAESQSTDRGLWREQPVTLVEFFRDFLKETPFPGKQTELLEMVDKILDKDNLPEGDIYKSITEIAALWGKGCKSGASRIVDADTGKVWTLKELAEEGKCINVVCVDQNTLLTTTSLASPPTLIGQAELFKVTTVGGLETTVTTEHVFMVKTKGGVKWSRLCKLSVGDIVAVAPWGKSSIQEKGVSVAWDELSSISSDGEDDYYDLSVLDYGNYISDGFIDHNSGKDFIISGIVAYIPYRLNCMYDPQEYFNFGKGEPIDIINLAKNAKQAENVFFTKLKARLNSCDWFKKVERVPITFNEYQEKKDTIVFFNNIRAFSGHSEAGSFEGFNPLVGIFDEVGDFEYSLAEFCYNTIRSSAMSRFGKRALLLFISFPRSLEDFMSKKYEQGISDDFPEVLSTKGASWEVNLNISREDLQMDYDQDPEDAKTRYECEPPKQRGGFFQYPTRIDDCVKQGKLNPAILEEIVITSNLDNGEERHFVGFDVGVFESSLNIDTTKTYYMGLDGGLTKDSYSLSLFHAETYYSEVLVGGDVVEKARNKPVEDLLLEWIPDSKNKLPVSIQNVIDIIEVICQRVFVKQALMDKFNSGSTVQKLMEYGVEAEDKVFSNPFQLAIYSEFKNLAYTGQLELLDIEKDNEDMKHILLVNGTKIDHEKDRGKDTSDARTAAVYLCSNDDPENVTNYSMPILSGAVRSYRDTTPEIIYPNMR